MMHLRLLMPCSARMREAASSVSADMPLPCLAASCFVCTSSWGMVLCTWGMPTASCSRLKTHTGHQRAWQGPSLHIDALLALQYG